MPDLDSAEKYFERAEDQMKNGEVETLIINDVNLFYNFYDQKKLNNSFNNIDNIIQLTLKENPRMNYNEMNYHFDSIYEDQSKINTFKC